MPSIPTRGIIIISLISLVLIFIIFKQSSYIFSLSSCIRKTQSYESYNTYRNINSITDIVKNNATFPEESPLVRAYLDVVRDTVCGLSLRTQEQSVENNLKNIRPLNIDKRMNGLDWPRFGITMVGFHRLNNIEWTLRFVIINGVPGDFIECGVWRGGSSIFARAILKALNIKDRHVWVADSFQGLPKARTSHDSDAWSTQEYLKVSLDEVQTNFRSFNLLDNQVHFCKGYFVDSLPHCNVSQIAVLRMDGDMYESTMDQLFNLYAKVQIGGVIIVDDYNIPECHRAIHDFRDWHGISEAIQVVSGDHVGHYWIKKKTIEIQMNRYKPLLVSTKNHS
ncbi:unnamed protein product [Rotaria socialis]|uniref:Macrocin O-methyltransferase n=2 Tax=Rotaria socialis TaxID=392032 RepID=A0A820V8K8_9BILA|nr:unnamed protein product [Rotaria socialis]CAF3410286.1 unnamed protein product [Rotaria socialis]CAF3554462.1 unnamed protein product [Rotaria socialis]CAF3697358.1 unnamed protein product [Rotaria socialis]CAF4496216.1 unnamed protein product [Rotaria socialis]